jgi:hypothetical protein
LNTWRSVQIETIDDYIPRTFACAILREVPHLTRAADVSEFNDSIIVGFLDLYRVVFRGVPISEFKASCVRVAVFYIYLLIRHIGQMVVIVFNP